MEGTMRQLRKTAMLLLCTCWLPGFVSGEALADTVTISNGDRLTGKVVRLVEGTLTLETSYSEPILIDAENIVAVETDDPVEMRLDGGELFKGRISAMGDGRLAIGASEEREPVLTHWEKVAAINPPPVPPAKLKGSVTVGANMQSGNTDRSAASVALEATRRDARHRFSMSFLHNYAEEDDEINTRNTYGAFKYDYFFTLKTFGYLSVEMLKDEFKDLNLRTIIGPGAGYQFWDEEKTALGLEGGIAYFNEDREEGEDDHWITGRLAGNFRYRLLDRIEFSEKLVFYPSLENFGKYTLRNEASLSTPIVFGWALNLSNIIDYDSDPDTEGVKKTDSYWILGLLYEF
jgi:putative salt-induced outer membrane protein YdiY